MIGNAYKGGNEINYDITSFVLHTLSINYDTHIIAGINLETIFCEPRKLIINIGINEVFFILYATMVLLRLG
jgi:hypothetical protein